LIGFRINRDIEEPGAEFRDLVAVIFVLPEMLPEGVLGELAEFVVTHRGARGADDAGRLGQLPGQLAVIERRQ